MTRTEHLLTILAEECAEVAQRASKALRFGLNEVQDGQPFTNAQRIMQEYNDLLGVVTMLQDEGSLKFSTMSEELNALAAKRAKIEQYLELSYKSGTLDNQTAYDRGYASGKEDERIFPDPGE